MQGKPLPLIGSFRAAGSNPVHCLWPEAPGGRLQ